MNTSRLQDESGELESALSPNYSSYGSCRDACKGTSKGFSFASEDERALIEQLQAGNAAAFERMVLQYEDRLRAYCYRFVESVEDARDIVQDTFLKAYLAVERAHLLGGSLSSWLYRIAANNCIDFLRRRDLYRWIPWEHFADHAGPGHASHTEGVAADPGTAQERADLCREVRHILSLIELGRSRKYRDALSMKYGERLSAAEIALRLDLTPSAVKSMVHRARADFRTLYQEVYGILSESGDQLSEISEGAKSLVQDRMSVKDGQAYSGPSAVMRPIGSHTTEVAEG